MKKSLKQHFFLFALFFAFSCKEKTLFEQIKSEHSGIHFSNRIIEKDSINILEFEYVYNGAGVGIGDFDKDGRQDIFFSGNQVPNKLYINKGDFKFADISTSAAIEGNGKWCAGVVTVDINNDGWLDVYVAATVKGTPKERENLLYVNQGLKDGKPWFKEMAAEYGVNDDGHTENASFFDYDNDGDLDLYILTNITHQYPNQYRPKLRDGSNPNTDRLYRCDWDASVGHSVYTNVSKEAGITIEGYGLGLNICDINKDGWKDIYVTNDYLADDLLYINNGNGTFTDKAADFLKHTSNSAMGNDIVDVNNDGFLDIFAVDMLAKTNLRKKVLTAPNNYQLYNFNKEFGYNFQYMRNTLQLNNGVLGDVSTPMFSEVSMLAGVAETDWSWTPSLADFDNDGNRDLLITNGFPKDVTDRDFVSFRNENERFSEKQYLLEQIPEVKINNYAFRNNGNLEFEDVTEKWGLDIPSFSNGAVYADLDNDGDLDYVVNNINDSAFVFKNNLLEIDTKKESHFLRIKFEGDKFNKNGIGAVAVLTFENGEKTVHENNPYRGYLSSVEPFVHFGIGQKKVKSLEIQWYNGISERIENPKVDQVLVVKIENARQRIVLPSPKNNAIFREITDSVQLDFVHQEYDFIDFNVQNLLPFKLSELGPGMSVGDINNDGLDDVFLGGSSGFSGVFFMREKAGGFSKKYIENQSEVATKKEEDLGSLLFDADNDGDLDLYICRGGNEGIPNDAHFKDAFYSNDGNGNFTKNSTAIPAFATSTSCVRAADFDNDGDLDLVVSGRNVPGEYPKFVDSYLFRNDSQKGIPKFSVVNSPVFKNLGLVCDVLWTDFNNDGWVDLLVAGEWAAPKFLKNNKGKFEEITNTGLDELMGLWSSVNAADLDGDGDTDYVLGNIGLNNLLRATQKEPVKVIAKDFDGNGNYDIIPFTYFEGADKTKKLVPFNGKDDVNKQLNSTRARFVTYKDFAEATYDNLLTNDEKKGAQELTLTFRKSVVLKNIGKGKFDVSELPIEAQFSPINGILIEDFDKDGYLDIVISGNNYGNEVSSGRYDASNGLFLKGNGNGGFTTQRNSGFYVPFDAKAMVSSVNAKGEIEILVAQNREKLKLFKTNLSKSAVIIPKQARYFTYQVGNKTYKKEFYYGASYLGQSSRYVSVPSQAKLLKIH
jgi:enediyne biosynthesis protein E4